MKLRAFSSLAFCAALIAVGCSDDSMSDHDHDGDHDDHGTEHDHSTCGLIKNCMDTVDLKKGLTIDSDKGKFSVEVVSFAPLSVDQNDIVFTVKDASGDAVDDAKIVQDVFSVDCMHGGEE